MTALDKRILQKQRMERLGILCGGIVHDFNNLLMGVIGNADLALMSTPSDSSTLLHIEQIIKITKTILRNSHQPKLRLPI